tara:strand:- start:321 stop:458 length:138 start_codon:yes stop_codon:yes gene_type:complete
MEVLEQNNRLIKTTDFLGREIDKKMRLPHINIYENGVVEKEIIVE